MTEELNNTVNLEADNNELYSFDDERPVGWSAGCVDEAIFYYLDCNYINMCNLESDKVTDNP